MHYDLSAAVALRDDLAREALAELVALMATERAGMLSTEDLGDAVASSVTFRRYIEAKRAVAYWPAHSELADAQLWCWECGGQIEHEVGGSFCTTDAGHHLESPTPVG